MGNYIIYEKGVGVVVGNNMKISIFLDQHFNPLCICKEIRKQMLLIWITYCWAVNSQGKEWNVGYDI